MLRTLAKVSAVMGLALSATFVTPVERVEASGFSSNCGGLGQKTCWNVNPSKRCDSGLVEKRQRGRNICVRPESVPDTTRNCGGLNQVTCISANPAKWCDAGLEQKRQRGRNICVRPADLPNRRPGSGECGDEGQVTCISPNPAKWCNAGYRIQYRAGIDDICVATRATEGCGGLNEQSCVHVNPARWCDDGLSYKPRQLTGQRGICVDRVTNADRLEVAKDVIEELGDNNPLADLTNCLKTPAKLARISDAINSRSNGGVNAVLRSCNADLEALRGMGRMSALNNGERGEGFKTISITVGVSGAAVVAGAAGAGIAIELEENPNARWFFTGGLGGGPKAEVVGDITVGLSRSEIPSSRIGFDHGIGAVVSGHYVVGLSGGVEFEGNTLSFSGISFGAGGGAGVGGAIYKTGAVFPFRDL